jgi:hypothetical protein
MCPDHPSVARNQFPNLTLLTFWRQSAVVRGAALRGLEGIAPRMKRARRHYGIEVGFYFREGTDPEELAYIDDFDVKRCDGRVAWLIAKAS